MCQLLKPCLLLTYEKPETFVLAGRMKRAGTFNERGIIMLKKLIKSFLGKKSHRRYSSSDRRGRPYGNPSKYGYKHYKRKSRSSRFSGSYSS